MSGNAIDKDENRAFRRELCYININRAKLYIIGLLCIHLILLIFDIKRSVSGQLTLHTGYRYLFYLHIILTAGLAVFLVLLYIVKAPLPDDIKLVHKAVFIAFIVFILLVVVSVSSIDQLIHGEITVYVIGLLALSAGAYLPLLYRLLIYIPAHIVMILGIVLFQTDRDILTGNIVNSSLVFLIALLLSQMMFQHFKKTFFAQRVIREQQEKLEKMSLEDSLTGLRNRRYIDTKLLEEWDRAVRYDRDLSAALADLDNFKQVNDSFGHNMGDEVLRIIGLILRGSIRGVDSVARYGGEEFLILLPETNKEQAIAICEKVRQETEAYPWTELHKDLKITISLGTAERREADSIKEFIDCSDKRLYKAKHIGRNKVCSES